MPFPNEHSARLKNPNLFDSETYRRTKGGTIFGSKKVPQSIGIIWGKLKGAAKPSDRPIPQALRFATSDWTVMEAKKWLQHNNINFISFESATKQSADFETDIKLVGNITKVDTEKRIVEGYASTEAVDTDGEIVTKAAMEEAIPEYMKLPGGGNLREMHQPSAAGKVPIVKLDDKGAWIRARVVDDNAWKKVLEKVYVGFSIGGKKLAQLGNKITQIRLSEISLVDRPANPEASFSIVKFDSSFGQGHRKEYVDFWVGVIRRAADSLNKSKFN